MRELLRAKSTIDYTSRGAVDRPNRATFKPLTVLPHFKQISTQNLTPVIYVNPQAIYFLHLILKIYDKFVFPVCPNVLCNCICLHTNITTLFTINSYDFNPNFIFLNFNFIVGL
jgi:hypothetical protein